MTHLHASYSNKILQSWHNFDKINFIYPVFITSDDNAKEEIPGFPNVYRWGLDRLIKEHLDPLVNKGLQSILLFGCDKNQSKCEQGDGQNGQNSGSLIERALIKLRNNYQDDLVLCADVCLCTYTSHGHCAIYHTEQDQNKLNFKFIQNKRIRDMKQTCEKLAEIALKFAKSGAHVIAPSDMQDGRVGAIKKALFDNNFGAEVSVLSYSAKFASNFYGPFRNACSSAPKSSGDEDTGLKCPVDRQTYQLPMSSTGLAVRASKRDVDEGADFLMVKPGLAYLDVISALKQNFPNYPIAVYQVSGEYTMIKSYCSIPNATLYLQEMIFETITSFKRAGANLIITYFIPDIMEMNIKF